MENQDWLTANPQDSPSELQSRPTPKGDLHLRFYLPSGQEFALPAEAIGEVRQQEIDRITPIPNASPLILGAINVRGQIVWVADLGKFLGDPVELNTDRATLPTITIEDRETILALVVDRLGGLEWLDIQQLKPATDVPPRMAPFVQKAWSGIGESREELRLLDRVALLRSARWAS